MNKSYEEIFQNFFFVCLHSFSHFTLTNENTYWNLESPERKVKETKFSKILGKHKFKKCSMNKKK